MRRWIIGAGMLGWGMLGMGGGCYFDMNDMKALPSESTPSYSNGGAGQGGSAGMGIGGMGGLGSDNGGGGMGGGVVMKDVCGDGKQGPSEACDDGNVLSGDSCTPDCSCGLDVPVIGSMNDQKRIAFSPTDSDSLYKGICYLRIREKTTWDNAKQNCVGFGLQLAILKTSEEMSVVHNNLLKDSNTHHWIGAERKKSSDPQTGVWPWEWQWLDGSELLGNDAMWKDGEPNNGGVLDPELCVQIFDPKTTGSQLNDEACGSDNSYYLCRTPIPPN